MARVCVDAGFLIGLFDESDQHHPTAIRHFETIFGESSPRHRAIIPWPILYECLGTRFARDSRKVTLLKRHWNFLSQSDRIVLLEDQPFREISLADHLQDRFRTLSLVDRVLRAMILDPRSLFDVFLTYNAGDFADACRQRRITLVDERSTVENYGIH